jgi:hypothetical protein
MSMLRGFLMPAALLLALVPAARAGDDDKKASESKSPEQTVKGVVSEITLLGETDVDYKTRKAITAEATFVTVIGHPAMKEGEKEKKGTGAAAKAGEGHRHRMNVYVLAVSPKTKVCECEESKGTSASKETSCEFSKVEIGDKVEVCFDPKTTKASGTGAEMKHGRHRIFFGVAHDIKIVAEPEGDKAPSGSEKK